MFNKKFIKFIPVFLVAVILAVLFIVKSQDGIAQKAYAIEPVQVYFSRVGYSERLTALDNLTPGDQLNLNLYFEVPTATRITGFDIEASFDANVLNFVSIAGGPGSSRFGDEIAPFDKSGNLLKGSRFISFGAQPVSEKLHIATVRFEVKQNIAGKIKFNFAHITSLVSPDWVLANLYDVNINQILAGGTTPGATSAGNLSGISSSSIPDGTWVQDSDVTFTGKVAARSNDFLNWVLQSYKWSKLDDSNSVNPFSVFWSTILKIVYAFSLFAILIGAFVIIATRGRNITLMRFIPRFIIVLLLITFSFSLIQLLYQVTDVIQEFFLRKADGTLINASDLLNIDFDYNNFIGYRLSGAIYDESVFISLLLAKLTALTYYIMAGTLLVRKIILWFFIIISPVFPLLLLYYPVRNTAKIWIGEFFRWLLYAPLFALFLSGLVSFWKIYIPLSFNYDKAKTGIIEYPTAVNILLGGPGQEVSKINSVNLPDTFILYVVSLLMLWAVIILPFILLRIFLDYLFSLSVNDTSTMKQFINTTFPILSKYGIIKNPEPPIGPSPEPPRSFGMARAIPFINKFAQPSMATSAKSLSFGQPFQMKTVNRLDDPVKNILRSVSINVPTMADIAKYETAMLSKEERKHGEATSVIERLEKIADPAKASTPQEVQQYNVIRDQLTRESSNRNSLASSILSVASKVLNKDRETTKVTERLQQIGNPSIVSDDAKRRDFEGVRNELTRESNNNNHFATSMLTSITSISSSSIPLEKKSEITKSVVEKLHEEKQKGNALASKVLSVVAPERTASALGKPAVYMSQGILGVVKPASVLPVVNRVQSVNIDDYETVKEMWQENYQKLDPPVTIDGTKKDRKTWINEDIEKITNTINLMVSTDSQKVNEGLEMVSDILPFLLIGGFSQTEIITYLKAKLQAAKAVLDEMDKKEEEEETQVEVQKAVEEKPKEMQAEAVVKNEAQ
ncbi:MAG: hypothetical protein Q7K55_04985 [Candidatus Levybacteria bacterium]|nr:hypothetical protein [Candidatus Levybacteria bacterium]